MFKPPRNIDHYLSLTSKKSESEIERIAIFFHNNMQHPKQGIISVGYIPAGFNNLLKTLPDYFDPTFGNYLLPIELHTLSLSYMDLSENPDLDVGESPCHMLADFIQRNPDLVALDLSNTRLTDKGCARILAVLNSDTRLQHILVRDNPKFEAMFEDNLRDLREKRFDL